MILDSGPTIRFCNRMLLLAIFEIFLELFLNSCGLRPANQTRYNNLLHPPSTAVSTTNTLLVDGTKGKMFQYIGACQVLASITSTNPLPDAGGASEAEISTSSYAKVSKLDAGYSISECDSTGVTDTQIVEMSWDLSSYTLANFSSFTVNWTGQTGQYNGACNGSTSPDPFGFTPAIEIYNGSAWTAFSATPSTTDTAVSQTFSNPTNYLASGKIWVRVYIKAISAECATIQTDFASLTLNN